MNQPDNDEFFIGWNPTPPRIKALVKRSVIALFLVAAVGALVVGAMQRTIGVATFEFGTTRDFQGLFFKDPVPMLVVDRTGSDNGPGEHSRYLLVNPFKFGIDEEIAARFDGQFVSLQGTLIYRDNQTMIEVVPETFQQIETTGLAAVDQEMTDLGTVTLRGEIVDSKCYFGVMNPGDWKPHRACAIRCISGGIPPVLHVRTATGKSSYFLLVSANGESINPSILPHVALPVEVTGSLKKMDSLQILYTDVNRIRDL